MIRVKGNDLEFDYININNEEEFLLLVEEAKNCKNFITKIKI